MGMSVEITASWSPEQFNLTGNEYFHYCWREIGRERESVNDSKCDEGGLADRGSDRFLGGNDKPGSGVHAFDAIIRRVRFNRRNRESLFCSLRLGLAASVGIPSSLGRPLEIRLGLSPSSLLGGALWGLALRMMK